MARQLVVYDPPIVGFPYLVVVLDGEPLQQAIHVQAVASREAAEAELMLLGDRLEKGDVDALKR